MLPSWAVHTPPRLTPSTYLHCSGGSGGAGADLEQPRCCRRCLASFPRGSTLVNNQRLSTKHAHQVRGLFPLHYSFLEKKKLAVSFEEHKMYQKWLLQPSVELEYSQSTQLSQVLIHMYLFPQCWGWFLLGCVCLFTCTGLPPSSSSSCTVRNAEVAISSCVESAPCLENKAKSQLYSQPFPPHTHTLQRSRGGKEILCYPISAALHSTQRKNSLSSIVAQRVQGEIRTFPR